MTARTRSRVLTIILFLLCARSSVLLAQDELTVQLLPGGDRRQLAKVLDLLASVAEEEVYVVEGDQTLADVVRERCGTATPDLFRIFHAANPNLGTKTLRLGTVVHAPACPRWYFDKEVTVEAGTTAWDIAVRFLGSGGERALAQLREANSNLDLSKLAPGQRLRVPYLSFPVSYSLKEKFRHGADGVKARFQALRLNGVGGRRVLHVDVAEALNGIEPLTQEPAEPLEEEPKPEATDAVPFREYFPNPAFMPEPAPEDRVFATSRERSEFPAEKWGAESSVDTYAEISKSVPFESDSGSADLDSREVTTSSGTGWNTEESAPSPAAPQSEPVATVAAGPAAAPGLCPDALSRQHWPFNADELARVLRDNRARAGVPLAPTVVAVVDTGIERADSGINDLAEKHELHPLSNPRFSFIYSIQELGGYRFTDDDGNSCEDDIIGTNLVDRRGFPEADPAYARGDHGIHVAGLVLGGFSSGELRQLARERVKLQILNAVERRLKPNFQSGVHEIEWRLDRSALIQGLNYATADIANYSDSIGKILDPTFEIIFQSTPKLLLVVAAGNDNADLDRDPQYPMALGGLSSPRVITVGAHNTDGGLLSGTNQGKRYVDLAAPGCAIESSTFGGGLKRYDGTSQAAPLVTFVAALLHAEGILTARGIKRRIITTVDVDSDLEQKVASAGRLNAVKALSVYDDVVVHGDRTATARGRILEPSTLDLCGTKTKIKDISQVVFDYSPESHRSVRITNVNALGHISYDYCNVRPSGVMKFETQGGEVEEILIESIDEIVPAALRRG